MTEVPTREEVRERYAAARYYLDDTYFRATGEAEFDAWFAEEIRKAKDEAYEEFAHQVGL